MSSQVLKNYHREIDQHYKRNVIGVMVDNTMFYVISLGLSPYTILPLYLSKLTDSKILIGLIPTISIIGFAFPQILIARFLIGKQRKKNYLIGVASVQRITILAFLILTLLQTRLSTDITIFLFFLIFLLKNLLSGCWFPMWVDFVGHSISRNRGMVLGLSSFIGGLLSLVGGGMITYLLESLPYPRAISAVAAIAFIASLISLLAIFFWHETIHPKNALNEENYEINSHFLSKVKKNINFQKYLKWRCVITGIEMALPFLTVCAIDHLHVVDSQVGIFAIILGLSQTVMNLIWGWLGDRIGYLKIISFSTFIGCLGCILVAITSSLIFFYLAFFCVGTFLSGLQLANINIIYEFSESDNVPTYTAIQQTVISPISGLMPILGGIILSILGAPQGYSTVFWVAGIVGFIGLAGLITEVENPFLKLKEKQTNSKYLK